jgi:glutaredoxin
MSIYSNVQLYRMSTPEHECPWGLKAAALLNEKGIVFEDIRLTSREKTDAFKVQHNVATTPQVFIDAVRIGGYTDLAKYLEVTAEKAEFSYVPVAALFAAAFLLTRTFGMGMQGFMGFALVLFSLLKLMDVPSFAASFAQYDLLTRVFKPYAYIYPTLELFLGWAFLSNSFLPIASWLALGVGLLGSASVFKAVYIDKLALNCACVGGNSKAPLGVVSFIENLMMVAMGLMLLMYFI